MSVVCWGKSCLVLLKEQKLSSIVLFWGVGGGMFTVELRIPGCQYQSVIFMPGTNSADKGKSEGHREGLSWVTPIGSDTNNPLFCLCMCVCVCVFIPQNSVTVFNCARFTEGRRPPVIYQRVLEVGQQSPYIWMSTSADKIINEIKSIFHANSVRGGAGGWGWGWGGLRTAPGVGLCINGRQRAFPVTGFPRASAPPHHPAAMAFNGTWKVDHSENYDKFMEQLGESTRGVGGGGGPNLAIPLFWIVALCCWPSNNNNLSHFSRHQRHEA